MTRQIIAAVLILALVVPATAVPALAQPEREAYNSGFEAGREDGPRDVSFLKILWGAMFGPLAMAYNIFNTPPIPDDRVIRVSEQGEDYLSGYLDGYRRAFKEQALMYNVIGWASWLLIAIIGSEFEEIDRWDTSNNPDWMEGY